VTAGWVEGIVWEEERAAVVGIEIDIMDISRFIYDFIIRKIIIAGRKLELAQAVDVVAGKTRREVEFKCSAALELKYVKFSRFPKRHWRHQ